MSDLKLMKEVDTFLNDEGREKMNKKEHLEKLLVCSDKVQQIHHPAAKKKVLIIIKGGAR